MQVKCLECNNDTQKREYMTSPYGYRCCSSGYPLCSYECLSEYKNKHQCVVCNYCYEIKDLMNVNGEKICTYDYEWDSAYVKCIERKTGKFSCELCKKLYNSKNENNKYFDIHIDSDDESSCFRYCICCECHDSLRKKYCNLNEGYHEYKETSNLCRKITKESYVYALINYLIKNGCNVV